MLHPLLVFTGYRLWQLLAARRTFADAKDPSGFGGAAVGGRSYTVPLCYVRDRRTLVCCTSGEWSAWWKNLLGGARVRGRGLDAEAWAFTDGDAVVTGLSAFLRRFPATATRYRMALGPGGLPAAWDVATAVQSGRAVMILVRVKPE